jgi:hypothetical protein
MLGLAAALLATQDAAAKPIVLSGEYEFTTFAKKDGRPICTERWGFDADGTHVVHSGQEVVTERFRTEPHDAGEVKGSWLTWENVSTNSQPDCMGRVQLTLPAGELRAFLYWAADGGIATCRPPADGEITVLSCYGHLLRPGSSSAN